MQVCAVDTIYHAAFDKPVTKLPNELQYRLSNMLWSTIQIGLNCTLPACLNDASNTLSSTLHVHSQVLLQVHSQLHSQPSSPGDFQLHWFVNSQPTRLYSPKYTPKRNNSSILTRLYIPMYTPACSIPRLAELETPCTTRREAGSNWLAVFGKQHVAYGVWQIEDSIEWQKSWHQSISWSLLYDHSAYPEEISRFLIVMVLTIVVSDSVEKVYNSNLEREDL